MLPLEKSLSIILSQFEDGCISLTYGKQIMMHTTNRERHTHHIFTIWREKGRDCEKGRERGFMEAVWHPFIFL